MDELVQSNSDALHMMDRKTLTLCIAAAIGNYLNFIGCTMSEETTYETAEMMIDTHPHLPVDAIKTFFYDCKRGAFGFHYNKMDGCKLLLWFNQFVENYYQALDDMEYAKHLSCKSDFAKPVEETDDEDAEENKREVQRLLFRLIHHGKTEEDVEREKQIADIRLKVIRENSHLYGTMPASEADAIIEKAIEDKLVEEGIINF